jgi:DNA polymerase III sliding clamp (beta) subunit (PCNA family)
MVFFLNRRSTQPPFDVVRLTANAGQLQLATTDGTSWLRVSVPCEGDDVDIYLPVRPLADFVAAADRTSTIEFVAEGATTDVACDGSISTLDACSGTELPGAPDVDSSPVSWERDADWYSAGLRQALTWVLRAVCNDETRPQLASVLFDRRDVVSTDGHRLHRVRLAGLCARPFAVSYVAAAALARMPRSELVTLERYKEYVRFAGESWQLTTKISESSFPPYRQVIPSRRVDSCRIEVDADLAASALKRLPQRTRSGALGVRAAINGELTFEREDEVGHIRRATVPLASSTHRGEDLVFGINARYLADAIADGVTAMLRFGGPLDPIVVDHGDGRRAVIMPVRL